MDTLIDLLFLKFRCFHYSKVTARVKKLVHVKRMEFLSGQKLQLDTIPITLARIIISSLRAVNVAIQTKLILEVFGVRLWSDNANLVQTLEVKIFFYWRR